MPADSEKRNIVIIGGGIIGCTTAYYLTHHSLFETSKHNVVVLETSKIAGGASGKAGGLLALWARPTSIVPLSFRLHADLAEKYGGADRWGYRRVQCGELVAKGRISTENSTSNRSKGSKKSGIPEDLDWLVPECTSEYSSIGGSEETAQVHPYQFTTSIASIAEEKGAKFVLGRVTAINREGASGTVEGVEYIDKETQTKKILPATNVVVAAGPWTRSILPSAPISALRAHSVTIRPTRPVSAHALFTEISLGQKSLHGSLHGTIRGGTVVTPEIYARPNNEVYACGEGDRLVPLPETTADVEVDPERCQDIVNHVSAISDELQNGEVTARQACYLPNVDGAMSGPLIGETGIPGLLMAAGHSVWGIQNGPATGILLAEMILDGRAISAKIKGLDPRKVLKL